MRWHLPATDRSQSCHFTSGTRVPARALSTPALPVPFTLGADQRSPAPASTPAPGLPRRRGRWARWGSRAGRAPHRGPRGGRPPHSALSYLQPALPCAKPWSRASANQGVASLIPLMHSLANLIPNKKVVDGRGGRGIRVKSSPQIPCRERLRQTVGQLRPQRGCVCLNDLLPTPSWRRAEPTRQL